MSKDDDFFQNVVKAARADIDHNEDVEAIATGVAVVAGVSPHNRDALATFGCLSPAYIQCSYSATR
jgi:hypothetical protein